MNNLILVLHGQSLWNLERRFTGFYDIDLTDLNYNVELIRTATAEIEFRF